MQRSFDDRHYSIFPMVMRIDSGAFGKTDAISVHFRFRAVANKESPNDLLCIVAPIDITHGQAQQFDSILSESDSGSRRK